MLLLVVLLHTLQLIFKRILSYFGFYVLCLFAFYLKVSKGEGQYRSLILHRHLTNRKKERWKNKVNDNQMEDTKNSNNKLHEIIPALFKEAKKLHS